MKGEPGNVTRLRRGPATADALRAGIDRGVSGDKVDFPDPAASPLGTDDEAAGTPPRRADVATAAAHEVARPPAGAPTGVGERAPLELREGRGIPGWAWAAAGLLTLAAIVFALVPLG